MTRGILKRNILEKIDQISPLPDRKYQCSICNKQYNTKTYLSIHERSEHKVEYAKNLYNCALCNYKHFRKTMRIQHLEKTHAVVMDNEYANFIAKTEFQSWKEKVEGETKSKLIQRSRSRKSKKYKTNLLRMSYFNSVSQGKRNIKSQGTNKINSLCPAMMAVKIKNSGYDSVRYTKTRIGHKNDLRHMTLSQSERNTIALKISSNVPFDSILDEIRESLTADGELIRLHLLRKMDLHNIENSFKLNSNVKKHKNHAISVNMWVNEFQNNDCCVLFYKPQQHIMEEYPQLESDDF
ncbi:hypothetical protein NQ314_012674 [Rhamnusium bicolor]|uniref:C2H2-type domain-containing protein n=1 Tax=Rhamnusium bicolor TaxID=1586634 RepID=A0AAV8X9R6_9CUCU|nr:hypothetical protein NQ314_012674 [Rhamnusium bicolor]